MNKLSIEFLKVDTYIFFDGINFFEQNVCMWENKLVILELMSYTFSESYVLYFEYSLQPACVIKEESKNKLK